MARRPAAHEGDLRDASVAEYITTGHMNLKEIRDQREALTLAVVADALNSGELSRAMDVISMRLSALAAAKSQGGVGARRPSSS